MLQEIGISRFPWSFFGTNDDQREDDRQDRGASFGRIRRRLIYSCPISSLSIPSLSFFLLFSGLVPNRWTNARIRMMCEFGVKKGTTTTTNLHKGNSGTKTRPIRFCVRTLLRAAYYNFLCFNESFRWAQANEGGKSFFFTRRGKWKYWQKTHALWTGWTPSWGWSSARATGGGDDAKAARTEKINISNGASFSWLSVFSVSRTIS